jgi:hypothetical protein
MDPDRNARAVTAALLRCFLRQHLISRTHSPILYRGQAPVHCLVTGAGATIGGMADLLVVGAVIVFVAAMLGMTWALGRL